jgi:predicted nucleic acid-binding protein
LILVDSSVWIAYFNGHTTRAAAKLDELLGHEEVAIGDLILTEVLQGFRHDREFARAQRMLTQLEVVQLGGREIALQAARNHRALRKVGVTVRKSIDTIIATWCVEHGRRLLFDDRDFDVFVEHLGLRGVA